MGARAIGRRPATGGRAAGDEADHAEREDQAARDPRRLSGGPPTAPAPHSRHFRRKDFSTGRRGPRPAG
ncbi:MAG: hypothetical protein MUC67_03295 [Acidobacteria bacterium]|nr:hypothetical protein [Acidobacteriota bacterium]